VRKAGLVLIAALACQSPALAASATTGPASPASVDATAAISAGKSALKSNEIGGLLTFKALKFKFASSPGTCPPGTSNPAYCVGGRGRLVVTLYLTGHGGSTVEATDTLVTISASATVTVSASLNHSALALLRSNRDHRHSVSATLIASALLLSASADSAQGTLKLH
jgi:hypothetical protein